MRTLGIYDLLKRRALVTRGSARTMGDALAAMITEREEGVVLDFKGVDAVSPSFVDEALEVIYETFAKAKARPRRIVFLNPPTRLSAKFQAIAKGRGVKAHERNGTAWELRERS